MDDAELARLEHALERKLELIREHEDELTELNNEARELAEEIREEHQRRRHDTGGTVHWLPRTFRPRPAGQHRAPRDPEDGA